MTKVLAIAATLILAGCTIPVQTTLTKMVVTEKDPEGKVQRITETETVTQFVTIDGVLALERVKFIHPTPPKKTPDFPPE